MTVPESVGYEQNPLSIYYCYDSAGQGQDGELRTCIAEVISLHIRFIIFIGFWLIICNCQFSCHLFQVTNTPWAERVMFTFQPGSDLIAKPLHVSPFMV